MKVALVKYYNKESTIWNGDDETHYSIPVFQEYTDWEELTDQELGTLRGFVARENNKYNPYNNSKYVLFLESDIPIKKAIKEQLDWMKKKEEEAKASIEKAKKEAADKKAKALLKKQKLSEEKEKALLESLKQKYESSNPSTGG